MAPHLRSCQSCPRESAFRESLWCIGTRGGRWRSAAPASCHTARGRALLPGYLEVTLTRDVLRRTLSSTHRRSGPCPPQHRAPSRRAGGEGAPQLGEGAQVERTRTQPPGSLQRRGRGGGSRTAAHGAGTARGEACTCAAVLDRGRPRSRPSSDRDTPGEVPVVPSVRHAVGRHARALRWCRRR